MLHLLQVMVPTAQQGTLDRLVLFLDMDLEGRLSSWDIATSLLGTGCLLAQEPAAQAETGLCFGGLAGWSGASSVLTGWATSCKCQVAAQGPRHCA